MIVVISAVVILPAGVHAADAFPARPIRLIVPYPPGGKCIGGMHAGRQNHHRADNNNHQGSLFDKVHG